MFTVKYTVGKLGNIEVLYTNPKYCLHYVVNSDAIFSQYLFLHTHILLETFVETRKHYSTDKVFSNFCFSMNNAFKGGHMGKHLQKHISVTVFPSLPKAV